MEFIYLNKEQAEKVRGRHGIYSELQPIEANDGMFILPKEVLNDKEHIETFPDLLKCKVADIEITEIIDEKEPDSILATKQVLTVRTISKDLLEAKMPISWEIYKSK